MLEKSNLYHEQVLTVTEESEYFKKAREYVVRNIEFRHHNDDEVIEWLHKEEKYYSRFDYPHSEYTKTVWGVITYVCSGIVNLAT